MTMRSRTTKPSAKTPKRTKTVKQAATAVGRPFDVDPLFVPVVDAFAKDRRVTVGKMMGAVNVKVNGKGFAMLVKGRLVAKLPKERVDALVAAGKGERFDPGHGRVMKEWIAIAPGKTSWVDLSQEAYRFVKEGKA